MFRRLFSSSRASRWRPASLPAGQRVYAVGDVHGRLDLLTKIVAQIATDDAGRDAANSRLILLGDYVDRGPDSAGVLRYIRDSLLPTGNVTLLRGNHEQYMLAAYDGNVDAMTAWLRYGGWETLQSYGIDERIIEQRNQQTIAAMQAAIPVADIALLRALDVHYRCGDYFFVHAGIRPGTTLDAQSEQDMLWIRERFLADDRDHGVIIVHGHSPTDAPELRRNRIGVDTLAYDSGRLTAVGLEGTDRWFIQTGTSIAPDMAEGEICTLINR
ncbi:MAG: serine/threonine protein phosphatase [Sphingomonadaceae bacterium]|nr:serine/threonine protein phosphatase [Sphingomonadaceae bacterium]